jgi:Flp pilus assembly protein protease CpaA
MDLMIQLLEQGLLIAGGVGAAATDAKTGYIYDWITYPMIGLGLILSIIGQQYVNIAIAIALFLVLFATYRLGKIGGGDVKLFVGIALLNPTNNLLFLANMLFFAAMGAMIFYSIYYTIKYFRVGINLEDNKNGIKKATIFGIILLAYFGILLYNNLLPTQSLELLSIPIIFGLIMVALQDGIKKNFFETKVNVKDLEEDEVIAEGRNNDKVLKLLGDKKLIGDEEQALLKKNKIQSIYVLRGLPPFGPFILLGIIGAILMPEFIMFLFL